MTDVEQQKMLARKHGHFNEKLGLITFPLNTDGFDIRGINVLVENVYVENFDDAVVPKPMNTGHYFGNCTENIWVSSKVVRATKNILSGAQLARKIWRRYERRECAA